MEISKLCKCITDNKRYIFLYCFLKYIAAGFYRVTHIYARNTINMNQRAVVSVYGSSVQYNKNVNDGEGNICFRCPYIIILCQSAFCDIVCTIIIFSINKACSILVF